MSGPLPARALRLTAGIASALLISCGCEVGPNYKEPRVETPGSFSNATTLATTAPTTSPATTRQSVIDAESRPWVEWWTRLPAPFITKEKLEPYYLLLDKVEAVVSR